jgi:hypothetical protein
MVAAQPMGARIQRASQPKVAPQIIPVSISGWNTRDAVTAMDPTDAIILDNWYPDYGGLTVRQGSKVFCTGLGPGFVNTLAEYSAGAHLQFLAARGNAIYNITSGTAVKLHGGYASDVWQTANFNGRIFFVNGVDEPQSYDGTTLGDAGFTGTTTSEIIGVEVFKQRLFFWRKDSQSFWYATLNAITGALVEYPLSGFAKTGGNVIACTTISHDGGEGISDLIVFILSTGETIIFQGTDPEFADSWQVYGRYHISPPVSPRAVAKYSADAYLTTSSDYVPLQQQLVALKVGQVPPRSKASGAVSQAVAANQNSYGWQTIFYPKGQRLIFNVPNPDGTFDQHIFNTQQNAYCRFTGNNGASWCVFNSNLYYGGASGIVYQADVNNTDSGTAISFDGQCAWQDFGDPRRKRLSAVRPTFSTLGVATINFGTGFDYETVPLTTHTSTLAVAGSPWDISPWDTSPWSPETGIDIRWRLAGGTGTSMSYRVQGSCQSQLQWLRTDVRYEGSKDI